MKKNYIRGVDVDSWGECVNRDGVLCIEKDANEEEKDSRSASLEES